MSVDSGPTIKLDALKVCLDAANKKSYVGTGNLWSDLSFNGNNASLVGSPPFISENAGVFFFSGASTYASGSSMVGLNHGTSEFTYSTWINFSSFGTNNGIISNGSYTNGLLIRYDPPSFLRVFPMGIGIDFTYSFEALKWYNLAITRRGGFVNFYINGLYQNRIANSTNIVLGNTNVTFGVSQHNSSQRLTGKMANALIYATGLTDSEVFDNFSAHRHRFGI